MTKEIIAAEDGEITLKVNSNSIVFVIHSDGTRDLYCPETADEVPRCQIRGMVEAVQDILDVLKSDICNKCDKKDSEDSSVLPTRVVR